MWWLANQSRSVPRRCESAAEVSIKRQPVTTETRRVVAKRPAPLADYLTTAQNEANLTLSEVQCGHETEIDRLLRDVSLLEKTVRRFAEGADIQQAAIETKESQLQETEEKAETLEDAFCEALAQWDTQRNHTQAAMQRLSEQHRLDQQRWEENLIQLQHRLLVSEDQVSALSTSLSRQEELLSDAQGSVGIWQSEALQAQASRRSLSEQMERRQAVFDEEAKQAKIERVGASVLALRQERLESQGRRSQSEHVSLRRQLRWQRKIRETELSEVLSSHQQQAMQIAALDCEAVTLRKAVAANQQELKLAWSASEVAANQLHLQELALARSGETERRIIEMQSSQFDSLRERIGQLVDELDQTRAEHRDRQDETQREHCEERHRSAKLRAQLSGGKARGSLLMEKYTERLMVAKRTIASLQAKQDELRSIIREQRARDLPSEPPRLRDDGQHRAA